MSGYLSREDILEVEDRVTEDVAVPEWGGAVRVRSLSAGERDKLEEQATKNGKLTLEDFTARFAAASIVDENGQRMFSGADVRRLSGKSSAALHRVQVVAKRLSAVTEDRVAELTGNSAPGQSDGSASGWPGTSE